MREWDIGEIIVEESVYIGELEFDEISVSTEVLEHYLDGTNVVIVLTDGTKLVVDISGYIGDDEPTPEQIEAINAMNIAIKNGELVLEYDEQILDFDLYLDKGDLIVDNNIGGVDFNINDNEELEVSY